MKSTLVAVSLAVGCSAAEPTYEPPVTCPGEGDYPFADVVVRADGEVESVSSIDEPKNAVNGVRGDAGGSKDVLSRGYTEENSIVVVRWSERRVVNSPGDDFVIFENAFNFNGGVFMDLAVVSVSLDGESWATFPHDYIADDETTYVADPELWLGFAGKSPVSYSSADPACSDPLDRSAGGDRFDLDSLPDTTLGREIKTNGFMFLKIQSAPALENPDTGDTFVRDPISDGFDLDGVYARQARLEE